jgi:hypothetical protein
MLNALDRFVAGNPHALALVRLPTEAQERRRICRRDGEDCAAIHFAAAGSS